MQKYHVVIVGQGVTEVEATDWCVDDGVLYLMNGDRYAQAFAKGTWVTIFNAPPAKTIVPASAAHAALLNRQKGN